MEIDVTGNTLRVFRLDDSVTPAIKVYDVFHPTNHQLYTIDLDSSMFGASDEVAFASVTGSMSGTCDDLTSIAFDPAGVVRCADPTTVRINDATINISAGAHAASVSFAALTGRAIVQ